jgi:hypothetical protein
MDKEVLVKEIEAATGIEAGPLLEIGLIQPKEAKKWLVRQLYYQLAKTGRTYADIKYELSDRFGISVSSIEKLIYRPTNPKPYDNPTRSTQKKPQSVA